MRYWKVAFEIIQYDIYPGYLEKEKHYPQKGRDIALAIVKVNDPAFRTQLRYNFSIPEKGFGSEIVNRPLKVVGYPVELFEGSGLTQDMKKSVYF